MSRTIYIRSFHAGNCWIASLLENGFEVAPPIFEETYEECKALIEDNFDAKIHPDDFANIQSLVNLAKENQTNSVSHLRRIMLTNNPTIYDREQVERAIWFWARHISKFSP